MSEINVVNVGDAASLPGLDTCLKRLAPAVRKMEAEYGATVAVNALLSMFMTLSAENYRQDDLVAFLNRTIALTPQLYLAKGTTKRQRAH
jgi:hypothetical protein